VTDFATANFLDTKIIATMKLGYYELLGISLSERV